MPRYFFTYQQIIEADSHDDAALKGIQYLTEDLIGDPYTEISISTNDLTFHYTDPPDFKPHKNHMIGVSKDARGRRTFTLVTDDVGDDHK